MGHSQAEKAQNRERILVEAARQVRAGGLDSLSIPALMRSVGLTHGGFYGHFRSRSELQAEAVKRALQETASQLRPKPFRQRMESYLSLGHRGRRENGCALAALMSDAGRADAATRKTMEAEIEASIERMKLEMRGDEKRSMVALSTMVGALAVSRVMTDDARAYEILKAAQDHLIALHEVGGPDPAAQTGT